MKAPRDGLRRRQHRQPNHPRALPQLLRATRTEVRVTAPPLLHLRRPCSARPLRKGKRDTGSERNGIARKCEMKIQRPPFHSHLAARSIATVPCHQARRPLAPPVRKAARRLPAAATRRVTLTPPRAARRTAEEAAGTARDQDTSKTRRKQSRRRSQAAGSHQNPRKTYIAPTTTQYAATCPEHHTTRIRR